MRKIWCSHIHLCSNAPLKFTANALAHIPLHIHTLLYHIQFLFRPASANKTATWMDNMKAWRAGCLDSLKLDPSVFEEPALQWTQTAYFQPYGKFGNGLQYK